MLPFSSAPVALPVLEERTHSASVHALWLMSIMTHPPLVIKGGKSLDDKGRGIQNLDIRYDSQVPNPEEPETKEEDREVVSFSGPVDSVYLKAKDYVELDVGTGAAVAISSSGWEDIVVVDLPSPKNEQHYPIRGV